MVANSDKFDTLGKTESTVKLLDLILDTVAQWKGFLQVGGLNLPFLQRFPLINTSRI